MLKAFIASLPLLLALAPAVAQDRPEQSLPAPMAGSAEALPSKETGYIESSMDAQGWHLRKRGQSPVAPVRMAATCFLTGEQASGMNKICYYDCLGSPAAITVSSVHLCPLSINR